MQWGRNILFALLALGGGEASANRLLVTNAVILTLDAQDAQPFTGYLLVADDGRIAALGAGAPPAGTVADALYDAAGRIVMPGFVSGHSHLWQSAFRGIAADQWVTGWLQALHRTYSPLFAAGDMHAFTLHGALDFLRNGITTAYNYTHRFNLPQDLYEEQYQAEVQAGARFIFGYALGAQPSVQESRRAFDSFLARVKAARPASLLKVSIAVEGGSPSVPGYLPLLNGLMHAPGFDVQMHFLEAPSSAATALQDFDQLASAEVVRRGLVFAHFVHATPAILQRAAAAGAAMVWNPLSNGRLASGLADVPAYLRAGMPVGMGLDGQASADISDPFENLRMGLYGLRMKYQDAKVMQPLDILRMHTLDTARVLGVDDQVGSLSKGKFGDLLIIDPRRPDTGPIADVYATVVFACEASNLERVYVGGRLLVERGSLIQQDVAALDADVAARIARIRAALDSKAER